jgi:hypothetical protein
VNKQQKVFVLIEVVVVAAVLFAITIGIAALFYPIPPETGLAGLLFCAWAGAAAAALLWLIPWLWAGASSTEQDEILWFLVIGIFVGVALSFFTSLCAPYELPTPLYFLAVFLGLMTGLYAAVSVPDKLGGRVVLSGVVGLLIGGGFITVWSLEPACLLVLGVSIIAAVIGVAFLVLLGGLITFHQTVMSRLNGHR